MDKLTSDPDILAENAGKGGGESGREGNDLVWELEDDVELNVVGNTHEANSKTVVLLAQAGGLEKLRKFTEIFYKKAFADPHIDKFIRSHNDPHGERFATWIAEKLGDPTYPWQENRRNRGRCPVDLGRAGMHAVTDRSSAHYAAWHSPKREASKWGSHFNLQDSRVWLRLHFWALRESGLMVSAPHFSRYYAKFIGHFVRVYERQAQMFVRDSIRWSEEEENTERYLERGRTMPDVMVSDGEAIKRLPKEERGGDGWPYV